MIKKLLFTVVLGMCLVFPSMGSAQVFSIDKVQSVEQVNKSIEQEIQDNTGYLMFLGEMWEKTVAEADVAIKAAGPIFNEADRLSKKQKYTCQEENVLLRAAFFEMYIEMLGLKIKLVLDEIELTQIKIQKLQSMKQARG